MMITTCLILWMPAALAADFDADRPADATAGLTCPLDAVMIVSATATIGARATNVVTRQRRLAVALRARTNPTTASNPLSSCARRPGHASASYVKRGAAATPARNGPD